MIKNTALVLVANGILRYLFFQKIFGQIYVRAVIYQILYFTMRNKKWSNWKQSRIVKFLLMHFRTGRYVELIFQCMFYIKMCIKQLEIASTCCPTFYDYNNKRCRLSSSFKKTWYDLRSHLDVLQSIIQLNCSR